MKIEKKNHCKSIVQTEACQDYYSFMNGISHISSLLFVYVVFVKRDLRDKSDHVCITECRD